ncbi:MAG: hypothetical protein ABW140_17425, partial [Candidatus Sedimenticola sp. 6PFRAG1]
MLAGVQGFRIQVLATIGGWRVPAVGINRSRVADSQHHPVCVTFPPPKQKNPPYGGFFVFGVGEALVRTLRFDK